MDGERVAKALARSGVASRREVERMIAERRVALNGQVLETPAVKIGAADVLTVDGRAVAAREPTRLWRYHKPTGLVTSNSDPQGRPTVFQALPPGLPRVITIGRLDLNSEGLLLLTNDGELARALELPSTGWLRRYRVRAYGRISQARLDTLADGVTIDGVVYGAIEARLDKVQHRAGEGRDGPANAWITVGLSEGKNREVRRVLDHLGLKVNRLIRLAYGPFALNVLPMGAVEEVGPRVIREQLGEFISPENLPTGSLVKGGVQLGGQARAGAPRRSAANQTANQAVAKRGVEDAGPEAKKVYKAGWAKPKPRAPGGKPAHAPGRTHSDGDTSGRAASPYRATLSPRTRGGVAVPPSSRARRAKPCRRGWLGSTPHRTPFVRKQATWTRTGRLRPCRWMGRRGLVSTRSTQPLRCPWDNSGSRG